MPAVWLSAWLLSFSWHTTTCGSTMTEQLCLPGISLQIEECTQCGASSSLSMTLGESMATRLPLVRYYIFQFFTFLFLFLFQFPFPCFHVFQLPPWSALAGPFLTFVAQMGAETTPVPLWGVTLKVGTGNGKWEMGNEEMVKWRQQHRALQNMQVSCSVPSGFLDFRHFYKIPSITLTSTRHVDFSHIKYTCHWPHSVCTMIRERQRYL